MAASPQKVASATFLKALAALLLACFSQMATAKPAYLNDRNMPLGCIAIAAHEYGLPPRLLHALYLTERGKTGFATVNSNGTLDHGAFSINTRWLKEFAPYGISASRLTWDPLLNARIGAWILKSEIVRAKGDVWRGVGNYRSRTPKYHNEQVQRVAKRYREIGDIEYKGQC